MVVQKHGNCGCKWERLGREVRLKRRIFRPALFETEVDGSEPSTSANASEVSTASVGSKWHKAVRRHDYLKYGFSRTKETKKEPRPQCVLSGEVLSSEGMKQLHLNQT